MVKPSFNSYFSPLNDFNQTCYLVMLLTKTNCSLEYDEYAELMSQHLNKRFSARNIEIAISKLPVLFGTEEPLEDIINGFAKFNNLIERASIRVARDIKKCSKCYHDSFQISQFRVTCYDHNKVSHNLISVKKCTACYYSFLPSYYFDEAETKYNYDSFNNNNYFLLSQQTAFTKNFLVILFTLVFKNALSIKGRFI
jgi:hypothetical protein